MEQGIVKSFNIEDIEKQMLKCEQVICPVEHIFGDNIYIRQVTMPAGIIAVGHEQKYDQMNIMIKGKVAILIGGEVKVLEAPLTYQGKAGRKIGYVIEETIWQNVYSTSETNIEKLEETYLNKSEAFIEHETLNNLKLKGESCQQLQQQ